MAKTPLPGIGCWVVVVVVGVQVCPPPRPFLDAGGAQAGAALDSGGSEERLFRDGAQRDRSTSRWNSHFHRFTSSSSFCPREDPVGERTRTRTSARALQRAGEVTEEKSGSKEKLHHSTPADINNYYHKNLNHSCGLVWFIIVSTFSQNCNSFFIF